MIKNRKFILFLVALVAIIVLSILNKDTAAVVTLYGVYACGNVGAKFSTNIQRHEIT